MSHNYAVSVVWDDATGSLVVEADGGGQFREVVLRPAVVVADGSMVDRVPELHLEASSLCFIARSVNFPVRHQPSTAARNPA